jgi:hypothetical protein
MHILLHRPSLNYCIATLAIVVTAQPICDGPCAAAHMAKQELSARNLRDIHRYLRLNRGSPKNYKQANERRDSKSH